MRNRTLIKCLSLALAASLAIVGCDSNDDNVVVVADTTGVTGTGTGGGGGSGGTGTGTGSAGLTGATLTGIGSGGSNGTTGTSGTGTTGTSNTGTTTGTSTGATTTTTGTGGNFNLPVENAASLTSLNNPTQMVRLNDQIFFVDGFNLGANNGRLMVTNVTQNTAGGTLSFSTPVEVTPTNASTVTGLTNPFGLATDGTDLFLTVGFNATQEARIVRVTGLTGLAGNTPTATFSSISDAAGFMNNPAFLLIAGDNSVEYAYWTEYSDQNSSGRVRRARTDGTGVVDVVVNGLNFPAGLATDGTSLVIADSAGGQSSLGQVVRVPLSFTSGGTALTPTSPTATVVGVAAGDQAITRPFDVFYDGTTGFYFTEGNAIEGVTGISATGQSNGTVRFLPRNGNAATIVVDGVTSGAGIHARAVGGGLVGLLYTESIATNGRLMRAIVNPASPVAVTPSQIETGLNRPLDALIFDTNTPVFMSLINYNGGQSNGLLNGYRP